jgi:uncharacterized membrane protein
MSRRIYWPMYLKFAALAAIVYCIPVIFFLRGGDYTDAWLLYIGNFLFLFPIMLFLFRFNWQRKQNASSVSMLSAGHITTAIGVIMSCILCLILMLIMVPGYLQSGTADKVLQDAPANMVDDKTNGLSFMVFADAIFGNVSTGSFISIIYPFSLKRDQTKEKVPRKQAEL